jgi:fibronectin-binding autotransporter adhesin
MKMSRTLVRSVLTYIVACLAIPALHAGPVSWNNAAGGKWSVGANWLNGTGTGGIPGPADDVSFLNIGAGTPTTNDVNVTINSLTYQQGDGLTQTTTINAGVTLQITDGSAPEVLFVGSTTNGTISATTQTPVVINGPGTLNVNGNGTGALLVSQGWTAAAGTHMATLDLSGLSTFTASVGYLYVGQENNGQTINGVSLNRPSGTLLLAQTNNIVANGPTAPQVMIQDSPVNANGGTVSLLELGQVTSLWADQMRLGGQKGNGTVEFNPVFVNPTLNLRNTDGASPITLMVVGDNSFVSSGNSTVGLVDLSLGSVDALATTVYVARGNPGTGTGTCTGTLAIGAGLFDVTTTMIVGYQISTGANGAATGTVNLFSNNVSYGSLPTGGTLEVGGTLTLAKTNAGGTGAVVGTINVTGGTLMANTIVSGGGNSSINLNPGSTLTITNNAGTLAAPITTFGAGGAILNLPAANAGATLVASNIITGTANTINITAVPPVSSYPQIFTLINYQTGDAGGGNFFLGTLPSSSPSYQGTIQDTGNGVVTLKLTAGPTVGLSMLWTGAANNSWDPTSFNWLYNTIATNFFAGAASVFNDTSTQTNVNLAQPLSPGSVTVANTNNLYTFEGAGNIAGAAFLAKQGPGALILDNSGVDNFAAVTLTGMLQLGEGDTNGGLSAVTIADNGSLVVDRTDTVTLSAAISGTGSLTNEGGTLVLSGSNSYSGPTVLTSGALILNGSSSGTGALTTAPGTLLGGSGSVNGAVTVGGQLIPGPVGGQGGVFTASNGLTLSTGSTLTFDLSPTDSSSIGSSAIAVNGNLVLHNNQITVNFSGPPQPASYPVITYTGTLSGSFNPVIAGTHYAAVVDTNSTPGTIYVTITGFSGASLEWDSTSSTTWDSITTNWLNLQTQLPSTFLTGDYVVLNDATAAPATLTIAAGVSVSPSVISNNSVNNFTISGAGRISGSTSILKTNTGTLIISTANTFTGTVEVQDGVLATANGSALGNAVSTTVDNGATLDVDGQNLGAAAPIVSGAGFNGEGAIYNSGGTQAQVFRVLTLAGDTTLGGTGSWGMNNSSGTASLNTGGSAYSITKIGANTITFDNLTTFDAGVSNIDIQQGILEFEGLTPGMGNPAATNIVESGAQLEFVSSSVTWSKNFIFNGDGTDTTVAIGTSANAVLAGNVQLSGDCVFSVGGTGLEFPGVIAGTGGIIKNGASVLTLDTNDTYTGNTTINTGTFLLNTAGSIGNSAVITIGAGAILDVSQRTDTTLTLSNGQSLEGAGVLNGSLIAGAGSIVSPGQASVGTLTVTNSVVLLGGVNMDLDLANATNDMLVGSSIKYGGALNITYLSGPPASGASFKLFQAASYSGSFSSLNPTTPGPGQTWDTSALGTSGTIRVVAAGSTPPRFGGITVSGTNLVFSGSNGMAAGNYYVLTSTNIGLPLTNWTPIATNAFDGSGNFKFTNNISPLVPSRFFLLRLP